MPFLSVIVPVYNMEKYIVELLDSLIVQTYKDFEVIIIDDGSTDRSLAICSQYSNIDSRFKIYKKNNGGVASARQLGLEKSNGEYLIHADPDDYLPSNAFDLMVNEIKKKKCDICIGSYNIVFPNKKISAKVNRVVDSTDLIRQLAFGEMHGSLCNKMIKSTLCKEVCFMKNINYMEDKIFLIKILMKNLDAKICVIDSNIYYYRQRLGSYTNELDNASIQKFKFSSEILYNLLSEFLTSQEMVKMKDIAEIQIQLQLDPKEIKLGFFWLKILSNYNFKLHLKLIALFLVFGIKLPLIVYRKYLDIKRNKIGIY